MKRENVNVNRKAKEILGRAPDYSPKEGDIIIDKLLGNRELSKLSKEDGMMICCAYNWKGDDSKAFATAKALLTYYPDSKDLHENAMFYLSNFIIEENRIGIVTPERILEGKISKINEIITEKIGCPVFWYLKIADLYVATAVGVEDEEEEDFDINDQTTNQSINNQESATLAIQAIKTLIETVNDHVAIQEWGGNLKKRYQVLGKIKGFSEIF